jgi:hypothetical protein
LVGFGGTRADVFGRFRREAAELLTKPARSAAERRQPSFGQKLGKARPKPTKPRPRARAEDEKG